MARDASREILEYDARGRRRLATDKHGRRLHSSSFFSFPPLLFSFIFVPATGSIPPPRGILRGIPDAGRLGLRARA